MSQPSTITLNVQTTADTSGLAAAGAAVAKLGAQAQQAAAAVNPWTTAAKMAADTYVKEMPEAAKAVVKLSDAQRHATVTMNGVEAAGRDMRNGMVGNAQAMLQLSRGVQDAQYGVGGLVNNIEGITMALGMGAGLAGVLTVAAVGFDILDKNTDVFGRQTRAAAEKAAELSAALTKAADESKKAADAADAATSSEAKRTAALEATKETYEGWAVALERAVKARERLAALEGQGADADKNLALAELEKAELAGKGTPEEFAARRRRIEEDARFRKFEIEERQKTAEIEAAKQNQAFHMAKQKTAEKEAWDAQYASEQMLSPKRREALEEELKKKEERRKKLAEWGDNEAGKAEAGAQALELDAERQRAALPHELNKPAAEAYLREREEQAAEARRQADKLAAEMEENYRRMGEIGSLLGSDDEQRENGGFGSKAEAAAAAKAARERAEAARMAAMQAGQDAVQGEAEKGMRRENFGKEIRAGRMDEANDRERMRQRNAAEFREREARAEKMEKEYYEREREAKERAAAAAEGKREQARRGIDSGTERLADIGRRGGLGEAGLGQLEEAGNQVAKGSDDMVKTVERLTAMMLQSGRVSGDVMRQMKRVMEDMQRDIDTLKQTR
jgi:hypothetical protein